MENKLKLVVELPEKIDLRYYRGWTVTLDVRTETFESNILGLFGFGTARDLLKAIDASGRAS